MFLTADEGGDVEAACGLARPKASSLRSASRLNELRFPLPPSPFSRFPSQHRAPQAGCCTAGDAADARRRGRRLDIPFYALNFEEEFGRLWITLPMVGGWADPNPCVVCNTWLSWQAA